MTFRQNLKAWRERHTLDQAAAAAVLGISRRTLENWECGRNEPNQWRQPGILAAMAAMAAHDRGTPAKTAPKPAPGNKRPTKSNKP